MLSVVDQAIASRNLQYTKKNASITVRIFDARRELEINRDYSFVETTYMPANDKEVKKFNKQIKCNKLSVPDNGDEKEYLRQVVPLVKAYMDNEALLTRIN